MSAEPASRRPILLVDDSREDAELVERAFREAGFDNPIRAIERGEDAIKYLSGEGEYADRAKIPLPGLMLLDPRMVGVNGWEVLEWVRKRPSFRSLPVIIFSGSGYSGDAEKARQLGANAYEIKPQAFEDLVQVVRRVGEFWLRSIGGR
jgi:CheY-like chemotaxis protein